MYKITEIKTSSKKKGQIYEQKDLCQKYRWSEKIETDMETRNSEKQRHKNKKMWK